MSDVKNGTYYITRRLTEDHDMNNINSGIYYQENNIVPIHCPPNDNLNPTPLRSVIMSYTGAGNITFQIWNSYNGGVVYYRQGVKGTNTWRDWAVLYNMYSQYMSFLGAQSMNSTQTYTLKDATITRRTHTYIITIANSYGEGIVYIAEQIHVDSTVKFRFTPLKTSNCFSIENTDPTSDSQFKITSTSAYGDVFATRIG